MANAESNRAANKTATFSHRQLHVSEHSSSVAQEVAYNHCLYSTSVCVQNSKEQVREVMYIPEAKLVCGDK